MAKKEKFMSWIKSFTHSSFNLFAGNILDAFQPLDFFHFYPLWHDLWVKRIAAVIKSLDLENKKFAEVKHILPPPSNMRAILQKLIPCYQGVQEKNIEEYKTVTNFFARMLSEACPTDPFAMNSNIAHSEQEIGEMIKSIQWKFGDSYSAKKIGRLITAAGSLVHGLYNDLATDFGWEAYGPYITGEKETILIRHFPDLRPLDLWSENFVASIKDLAIYTWYQDVDWEISFVGCHTLVKNGDPISGMKKFAVVADGRVLSVEEIVSLVDILAQKAETLYKEIRIKDIEETKRMILRQEHYQLKKMFDAAGLDWNTTAEIHARVENKPLLDNFLPRGKILVSVEEYKEEFGIKYFAKEVLEVDL